MRVLSSEIITIGVEVTEYKIVDRPTRVRVAVTTDTVVAQINDDGQSDQLIVVPAEAVILDLVPGDSLAFTGVSAPGVASISTIERT